ncbi:MBL fold metallo-hydrolase [Candidatus Desulfosporosinus nitrosoreducens]|uniref:MBL fold metallo-hydrolase n=1 Tax=Candidatus Desulfosporosinus nitrosoreducens TaxID=3401928 RepID=UPI0035ABFEAE
MNSILNKKYTRRRILGLGLLGTLFLAGGFTPAGKLLTEHLAEEVEHETTTARLHPTPGKWSDNEVTVAWLGHASFLINFFGTRIIADPALGSRIGITPIGDQTIGPRRYITAALNSGQVGPVDLLLISHAHTDHFDYPTLRQLQSPKTIAVTAKNTLPLWQGMKFQSIEEMHWGDSRSLAGVNVKAIEGKHWGARLPWDKSMEANSLLLSKNGVTIFFGGDTAYTDLIKHQLAGIPIDLAIMGIGAYSPKSFERMHATPEQAWKMAEDMSAKWIIPMHWGTFKLSNEPMGEPIVRFRQAASGQIEKIAIQEVGGTWVLPH